MIYFVLTKSPCFYCYGIYVISMEDAKLQNLSIESVFFLRFAINKALSVSTQSFVSFLYKIKHIETERYYPISKNHSGFGEKMWEQSVWVSSQLITTAQKGCCYEMKDK